MLFVFTPWGKKDADYLLILVGVWLGVALATYLTTLGSAYCLSKVTGQTRRDPQLQVYQHLRFLPCRFYDNHTTRQIMAYVNTDTASAAAGVLASGWIVATFPLYRCQSEYQKLLRSGEGAKRVFAFLDESPTEPSDGIEDIHLRGKVGFENVTFGYNETETVLENVTFDVQPGQLVALVGPSGLGKAQSSTSNIKTGILPQGFHNFPPF